MGGWEKQNSSVLGVLNKIVERLPAEQGEVIFDQGITGNFDFPGLREFIFREMLIKCTVEKSLIKEEHNQ